MLETIEWIGCITGLSGAAILAANRPYSGWGFALFLTSNVNWIVFGLMSHASALVVMQLGFTATSLMGVWKWLILPKLNSQA